MNVNVQVARKKGLVGNCTGLENNELLGILVNSTPTHAYTHSRMHVNLPSHPKSCTVRITTW